MLQSTKNMCLKVYWLISSQLGIDPLRFFQSMRGVPKYLIDWFNFRKNHKGVMQMTPCLYDRYAEAGTAKSEYFWQDLVVAQRIFDKAPVKHVDVGSRIDGFVAHVASFRDIEVFDVRPMQTQIPKVSFQKADLMQPLPFEHGAYCDSLSCLHALEHFGLGRYGDPIDPLGYEKGLSNMAQLLMPNGTFYLSTPVGRPRVEFNANHVFDPKQIVKLAKSNNLTLIELLIVRGDEGIESASLSEVIFTELAQQTYNLCIFVFTKNSAK
jgi:hypothetical protein